MLEKLEGVEARFAELEARLADPALIQNPKEYQKAAREHRRLGEIVEVFREYRKVLADLEGARQLLDEADEEMKELAKEELETLRDREEELAQRLRVLLLPRDPNDDRNVIMEIRAGAGGEEAALFAADLFRMYTRYAERQGWRVEVLDANETELGGYKEVIFQISGEGAYSRLKYEGGVHRVQRVPITEAQGRIQTSTATVAVLPEADEVDVEIPPHEVKIETQRASGAGGQHVNKTESAVRITHLPTGIVVYCQDERSQIQNRERAFKILRARLLEYYTRQAKAQEDAQRRAQVGTGERSERIRTYNFPENRVSDHRIKLTLYKLQGVLDGELDEIIDALIAHDQAQKLAAAEA
ncbi:MAG: peptide chain release factor 1 [Bacillota bacterium]|nr:MAG: peptide chain release factor 1 [Bacillota bacterium]